MNLEELERLAREADEGYAGAHPRDSNNWKANEAFCYAVTPETVLRLVAIAKAAERDAKAAERYRWLRDKALSAPEPCPWVVYGSDGNNADLIYGAELDAAIDAALIPPGCKPT